MPPDRVVVDHQWHWLPPECLETLRHRRAPPRIERQDGGWSVELAADVRFPLPPALLGDLDAQLITADEHGIDTLVCSSVFPAQVLHLPSREATELLEQANAAMASAQRQHPRRFVGLASLPLQDPEAALKVLDKAVDDGLRGVSMLSSIDGEPIASEATLPVFRRIDELGLPIVLHPAGRSSTSSPWPGMLAEVGVGWMCHTTLAALNLIESGALDACPSLVVLHPHLGGVLPYLLGRLDRVLGGERSLPEYVRRHFYTDTVGATPVALQVAIGAYGLDHVVFATDHPYIPIGPGLAYVEANASAEDAEAIFANVLPGLDVPSARTDAAV